MEMIGWATKELLTASSDRTTLEEPLKGDLPMRD
jgi:hypothetical protein